VLAISRQTVDDGYVVRFRIAANATPETAGQSHQMGIVQCFVRSGERAPPQAEAAGSAGTRHLMGVSPGKMRGGRVDLSCPHPVLPEAASVLASVNDGALRVALTRHH
jgi:hypothetical protein